MPGSNQDVDIALALKGELNGFLQQASGEAYDFPRTCRLLLEMHGLIEAMKEQLAKAGAAGLPAPSGSSGTLVSWTDLPIRLLRDGSFSPQ